MPPAKTVQRQTVEKMCFLRYNLRMSYATKNLFIVLGICAGMPLLCRAASLLESASFPKTTGNLSFVDRITLQESDYEIFKDLSPYDQLNIIYTDQGINDEVAADYLMDAQQAEQKTDANGATNVASGPGATTTPGQSTDTGSAPVVATTGSAPVATTPSSAPVATTSGPCPAPPTDATYCAQSAPHIPKNQKIPFGKPLSDYLFCSDYGLRSMGKQKVYDKKTGKWITKTIWDTHYGMDIGCKDEFYNKPVYATADGIVELAKPNRPGSSAGNYIVIDHGNGFKTRYMHLNNMLVAKGQRVQAGCQIATVGYTGGPKINKASLRKQKCPTMRKSISHLHYEILYNGSLKSVTKPDGTTVRIVHGIRNSNSIDPAPFMGVP